MDWDKKKKKKNMEKKREREIKREPKSVAMATIPSSPVRAWRRLFSELMHEHKMGFAILYRTAFACVRPSLCKDTTDRRTNAYSPLAKASCQLSLVASVTTKLQAWTAGLHWDFWVQL